MAAESATCTDNMCEARGVMCRASSAQHWRPPVAIQVASASRWPMQPRDSNSCCVTGNGLCMVHSYMGVVGEGVANKTRMEDRKAEVLRVGQYCREGARGGTGHPHVMMYASSVNNLYGTTVHAYDRTIVCRKLFVVDMNGSQWAY